MRQDRPRPRPRIRRPSLERNTTSTCRLAFFPHEIFEVYAALMNRWGLAHILRGGRWLKRFVIASVEG
jgi:hypothetical protein